MTQQWLGPADQIFAGAIVAATVWEFFHWVEQRLSIDTGSVRATFTNMLEAAFGQRAFSFRGFAKFSLVSFILYLAILLLSFALSVDSHEGEVAIWMASIGAMSFFCFLASLLPNYFCLAIGRILLAWKSWFAVAILLDFTLSFILSVVGSAFLMSMAVGHGIPSLGGMAGLLDMYLYLWSVAGPFAALSFLVPAFFCPLLLVVYAASRFVQRITKTRYSVGLLAVVIAGAAWEAFVILRRFV